MFAWSAAVAAALTAIALAVWLFRVRRHVQRLAAENQGLRQDVDDLAAASHARSRFLAMMSHEIRTPLTGIVGFAEVLTDETLSPVGRRAIDSINRASRSLQALLGDILDFSRIDAGALPMQPVPTDLDALLNEVRDEFAPQARQRGLAFGLSVSEDARRWTETDPLRLRQIVVNLVSNAIRYTEAGMIRIAAATTPDTPDGIVIQVSDTGIGIAPEDCLRIFDVFAQAADGDAARGSDHGCGHGGVGLGLAIADGLVRGLRGTLTLDSTLGQGSTFTVTLPLPPCPAPDQAARPAAAAEPAPNDGLNATYWTQRAVEFKANAYGQFMLAQLRLDQALADKSWTALPGEQAAGYESLPTAVILDLDETVMDNSGYQAWTVKSGNNFSSKTWTAYVNTETSGSVPGSMEFINYAQSKGVAIFYVSNRKDIEEKATIANLKALGYPVADDGSNVLVRGEKEEWKKSAKSPRRMAVGATHRVLLNIGDNLGDFTDESDGTPEERLAVYKKHQDMWGKQWIMIANPTYGSWEGAAFGFNWKLSDGEKRQMKLDRLDAWKGPE